MKTVDFKELFMKTLKSFIFLLSFSLLSVKAFAEQLPTFTKDSRMQTFDYTKEDVFVIKARFGYGIVIQFEDGETIHDNGGLGVGEARFWNIAVKGNNVFFKPLEAYVPPTNMIIVTNKRTYVFQLETTTADDMTYVARFNYPDKPINANTPLPKAMPTSFQRVRQGDTSYLIDAKINTAYVKRGNLELAPTAMWDDGLFTYLKYDNAKELPSVYKVMPDGSEMLVNTHIQDDTTIIHEVGDLYRLRLGRAVAELGNQKYQDNGFNRTGTAIDGVIRIVK